MHKSSHEQDNRERKVTQGITTIGGRITGALQIFVEHYPAEQFLIAQLGVCIVIQWLDWIGVLCSYSLGTDPSLCLCGPMCCFPVVFGIDALFGLFVGFALRNRKVKILSIVLGLTSVARYGPFTMRANRSHPGQGPNSVDDREANF